MQLSYPQMTVPRPFTLGASYTVVLLRHGECVHNSSGVYAGHTDSPLTERGVQQARDAVQKLVREIPSIRSFAFVSSPLGRAVATTRLLLSELSLDAMAYRTDTRLQELDFGLNTSRNKAEVQSSMPSDEEALWNTPHPDGESLAQLFDRTKQFLSGIAESTVVICHSGSARMLRAHFLGLSGADALRFKLGNGEAIHFTGNSAVQII